MKNVILVAKKMGGTKGMKLAQRIVENDREHADAEFLFHVLGNPVARHTVLASLEGR